MEAFDSLLRALPTPVSVLASLLLGMLWLLPAIDNLRTRRRLENAKLEREAWGLELSNAERALDLRRRFLGADVDPSVDAALVTHLLARNDLYSTILRRLPPEPAPEGQPKLHTQWLSSREPTLLLRSLDVVARVVFFSWAPTFALLVFGTLIHNLLFTTIRFDELQSLTIGHLLLGLALQILLMMVKGLYAFDRFMRRLSRGELLPPDLADVESGLSRQEPRHALESRTDLGRPREASISSGA